MSYKPRRTRKAKKAGRTALILILMMVVAVALIYFGKVKGSSTGQPDVAVSNVSSNDKYTDERVQQMVNEAYRKRAEAFEMRQMEELDRDDDSKQASTVPSNNSNQQEKDTQTSLDSIIKSNKSLEQKIRDYLGTNVSKVGLGYYDIQTGKGFSINGDKYFTAASTVKVQMNMVLFDMVKEGKVKINESLQYTQSDYEAGTGILQGKDKSKPIPLLTLSDYSIIYSDNIATNMIMRRIGRTEMKRRFGVKVGHSVPVDKNSVTPNEGMTFLKQLYENKDNNEYYTRLIGIMKTTVFHDRLDKYVPKSIVAHKIGNYGAFVNDVGIVYAPKPYIITVYTEGMPNANEVIANISKILYEAHK
jgi:beta-lactamase class A